LASFVTACAEGQECWHPSVRPTHQPQRIASLPGADKLYKQSTTRKFHISHSKMQSLEAELSKIQTGDKTHIF